MINLLYIIEGGHPGGAEQNLFTIIRIIDKTQYRIKVCLLKSSEILENELKKIDIPVFVLNINGKWDLFSIFKLCGFMRREKMEIVHTCLYASNTMGRIAAIFARIPVIIAWEQGEILYSQTPLRHHLMESILARFSNCIVSCSKACKEAIIRKEGVNENKIRVIYNCVDLSKFNTEFDSPAIRKQLAIKDEEIILGTVATLDNEKKGQEYLIKAMPEILNIYPNIKLLLVGKDGPSKSYFMQLVESLQLRNIVIFTGFRRDIPEIMNVLDLYVCPSLMEGLSISIIEAMASKKAVVATGIDGILEVAIDNQTCSLVPPKDVNSIAKAVITLLADREKMRQMGESGFQRVKMYFSSEKIVKELESLYRELLWKTHPKYQ